jgi:hypothetical protein
VAILAYIWATVFLRPYARVLDAIVRLLTARSETEKRLLAEIRDAERRSDLSALGALVARAEELTWGTQEDLARSLIRMRRRRADVDGLLRELAERSGEGARTSLFEVLSGTGDPLNSDSSSPVSSIRTSSSGSGAPMASPRSAGLRPGRAWCGRRPPRMRRCVASLRMRCRSSTHASGR